MIVDTKNYDRYKETKLKLRFEENGIQFNNVMSVFIFDFINDKRFFKRMRDILIFFKTVNTQPFVDALKSSSIVFTDSLYNRPDHSELLRTVKEGIDHSHVRDENLAREFKFNPKNIISSFLFVCKALKSHCSLIEIMAISAQITYYRNVADDLKARSDFQEFKCKKYIAFCNPIGIESLFAQFLDKYNIHTFTLSHGLNYVGYKRYIPLDVVNGENITTQSVFVWGCQSKKDLIKNFGISSDKIIVGGNPKYKDRRINLRSTFKVCIVLLGRKIYESGNMEILNIVYNLKKNFGIEIFVRLHASLSRTFYSEICENLDLVLADQNETLNEGFNRNIYDFAIVNNSTSYFEAMYNDLVCFRYAEDENEIFEGLEDKFSDYPDLVQRIESFKNMNFDILNKQVAVLLTNTLGMGINQYKTILGETEALNE